MKTTAVNIIINICIIINIIINIIIIRTQQLQPLQPKHKAQNHAIQTVVIAPAASLCTSKTSSDPRRTDRPPPSPCTPPIKTAISAIFHNSNGLVIWAQCCCSRGRVRKPSADGIVWIQPAEGKSKRRSRKEVKRSVWGRGDAVWIEYICRAAVHSPHQTGVGLDCQVVSSFW